MIVVMKAGSTKEELNTLVDKIHDAGLQTHVSAGLERTIVGIIGDERNLDEGKIEVLPGVERIIRVLRPFKLASREFKQEPTVITLSNGLRIGGDGIVIIAGPCAIENEESIIDTALAIKDSGAHVLRGGAYKPRTSPYTFQGLGVKGLEMLARAREESGLPIVTEVMSPSDVRLVSEFADILQVGARNMQNFSLLHALGEIQKPVLLKRGMMCTIEEWLMAAEHIMSSGNHQVILCERGIRTFETYTRNTMDLSAVPLVKQLSHLPIIADPSHATGASALVPPMAKASIAAGADGLMIEVHLDPENALSDGAQSLKPGVFAELMQDVRTIAAAVGRHLESSSKC
ncbi:MAG: 3-deoxy-7-phosphoheptulonate synthase [Firmicutes bacterium]|nr:3-deoxy-7-phosphoheptulonate synthase [Candidatus Fermentithermobacillaceae bacterium]